MYSHRSSIDNNCLPSLLTYSYISIIYNYISIYFLATYIFFLFIDIVIKLTAAGNLSYPRLSLRPHILRSFINRGYWVDNMESVQYYIIANNKYNKA